MYCGCRRWKVGSGASVGAGLCDIMTGWTSLVGSGDGTCDDLLEVAVWVAELEVVELKGRWHAGLPERPSDRTEGQDRK